MNYNSGCGRGDLNPHGFLHTPLKRARLPFRHFPWRAAGSGYPTGPEEESVAAPLLEQVPGQTTLSPGHIASKLPARDAPEE